MEFLIGSKIGFLVIVVIGYVAAFFLVGHFKRKMLAKADQTASPLDDKIVPWAARLTRLFLLYIAITVGLSQFGVNVAIMGSVIGFFGLAFGMGSKDIVSDVWASFKTMITRPYKIGDVVDFKKSGVKGQVLDITFFYILVSNGEGGTVFLSLRNAVSENIEIP